MHGDATINILPDDHLLLARFLDGVDKVLVVHCVDLSWATDERVILELVADLLNYGPIGAGVKGRGQDARCFEEFCDVDECLDIVFELIGIEVVDQLDQAGLRGAKVSN